MAVPGFLFYGNFLVEEVFLTTKKKTQRAIAVLIHI